MENFPSQEALFYFYAVNLGIAVFAFYLTSEWLVPRALSKNMQWLMLAPFICLALAYLHFKADYKLNELFLGMVNPEERPTFKEYFLGMFWFMVIATGISFAHLWYESRLQAKDLESLRIKAELDLLRYRVNPHFLFNTLNSLYALALERSEKTSQAVLQLSGLMRYMMQQEKDFVPLSTELEYLQNYLALEQLRLEDHTEIRFHVQGEPEGKTIAPMLLLPFVENAFKHGLNHLSSDGYLEIEIRIEEEEFFFYIENSKKKTTPSNSAGTGFGLANVKRRLELIYGVERFQLEILDASERYCVNLYIQLRKNLDPCAA